MMPRSKSPYVIQKRKDWKSYLLTLNTTSGLPQRICDEWQRKSFQNFPPELAFHSFPKSMPAAKVGADALIAFLKNKIENGNIRRISAEDITVGTWIEKFTIIDKSPRTGINASKNRSYSEDTIDGYLGYYNVHIKNDPFCLLKMAETTEDDAVEFCTRMSLRKKDNGDFLIGTRTFVGIVVFVRMTFKMYQRKNRGWLNPFLNLDAPTYSPKVRDSLPESEVIKLFAPGVLKRTMELAVCAAIFLSGLRRSEVSALKLEDLDWHTPKINLNRAWQNFDNKEKRKLGPLKGKRRREAPFDPVLQEAIKKLWAKYGKHEFVFSWKSGNVIGPSWIYHNFKNWLQRAGIVLAGREIVPHSARHSLASVLLENGISLKHIQLLLGHSSVKTTEKYLHATDHLQTIGKSVRLMGEKITLNMEQIPQEPNISNVINFPKKVV
jgi:integrase